MLSSFQNTQFSLDASSSHETDTEDDPDDPAPVRQNVSDEPTGRSDADIEPQNKLKSSPRLTNTKRKIFVSPKKPVLKKKKDSRMDEVYNILKETVNEKNDDEDEAFARYICTSLKKLDSNSSTLAKFHIGNIILHAQMGKFKRSTLATSEYGFRSTPSYTHLSTSTEPRSPFQDSQFSRSVSSSPSYEHSVYADLSPLPSAVIPQDLTIESGSTSSHQEYGSSRSGYTELSPLPSTVIPQDLTIESGSASNHQEYGSSLVHYINNFSDLK